MKKVYVQPKTKAVGDTKSLIIAAIHKGCSSSSGRS